MWIKITIKTTSQVENSVHFISAVKAEVSNTFRNMKNSPLLCLIFFSGNIMYKKNIKGSFSVIDSPAGRAWACWLHWNEVHSLSALHSQHSNKTCPWHLSSTNIWWHTYCRKKKKKKKGWVIFTGYSFSGRASSSMQPVKGKGPGGCSCYLWNETHSIQVCVQIAFPNVPPEIFSSVVTVQEDL